MRPDVRDKVRIISESHERSGLCYIYIVCGEGASLPGAMCNFFAGVDLNMVVELCGGVGGGGEGVIIYHIHIICHIYLYRIYITYHIYII